ncbi:rCG49837 [Rattus norvegicus]|uniref:RCG49837 n=1 Tax=Rattus norvegicus TaxID=10116 RepID=A6K4T3_RAT|nr:rCG49837 [Rattus norvegicus]
MGIGNLNSGPRACTSNTLLPTIYPLSLESEYLLWSLDLQGVTMVHL